MRVPREQLYEEVWAEPMTTVAKRYDVSSNYLARICERLNIPRPGRGYRAQRATGADLEADALPDAEPGDEIGMGARRFDAGDRADDLVRAATANPVRLARTGIRSSSARVGSSIIRRGAVHRLFDVDMGGFRRRRREPPDVGRLRGRDGARPRDELVRRHRRELRRDFGAALTHVKRAPASTAGGG